MKQQENIGGFQVGVLTYRYTGEMRGQWQGDQLGTYCSSASDT